MYTMIFVKRYRQYKIQKVFIVLIVLNSVQFINKAVKLNSIKLSGLKMAASTCGLGMQYVRDIH